MLRVPRSGRDSFRGNAVEVIRKESDFIDDLQILTVSELVDLLEWKWMTRMHPDREP